MAHDVFLSHPNTHRAEADQVSAALEKAGISSWLAPRDVEAGEGWSGAIVKAIDGSRLFLLIFAGSANESGHILRELDLAVRRRLGIVVLRVEKADFSPDIRYFVSTGELIDAIDPPLERHLERLAERVQVLLGRQTPARTRRHSPEQEKPPQGIPSKPKVSRMAKLREILITAGVLTFIGSCSSYELLQNRSLLPEAAHRIWKHNFLVDDTSDHMQWAREFAADGDYPQAIEEYGIVLARDTTYSAEAHFYRGEIFHSLQQYKPAIADYTQVIRSRGGVYQLSPGRVHTLRAEAFMAIEEYGAALQDCTAAIKLGPDIYAAMGYLLRGDMYKARGELDRALAAYGSALQRSASQDWMGTRARSYLGRGDIYLMRRDFDSAIIEYTRATESNPRLAAAFARRGDAYFAKGLRDLAAADHRHAMKLDPTLRERF